MQERRVVLVTGMPRSGTTAIGKRLTFEPGTAELYEPMNRQVGDIRIRHQFELIGPTGFSEVQARAFVGAVRRGLLWGRWPGAETGRNPLFNRTRRTMAKVALNPRVRTVVWKDPFAVFWADWLARQGDVPVVFTLRAPLATAASFVRMGWSFDCAALVERLRANGDAAEPVPPRPADVSVSCHSAAVLWRIIHLRLRDWLAANSPICVIEIEDNLTRPDAVAVALAAATGLRIAPPAPLAETSEARLPNRAHPGKRSSESITSYWRSVLTPGEIAFCNAETAALHAEIRALLHT
jgi:hypothetical protein